MAKVGTFPEFINERLCLLMNDAVYALCWIEVASCCCCTANDELLRSFAYTRSFNQSRCSLEKARPKKKLHLQRGVGERKKLHIFPFRGLMINNERQVEKKNVCT